MGDGVWSPAAQVRDGLEVRRRSVFDAWPDDAADHGHKRVLGTGAQCKTPVERAWFGLADGRAARRAGLLAAPGSTAWKIAPSGSGERDGAGAGNACGPDLPASLITPLTGRSRSGLPGEPLSVLGDQAYR